MGTSQYSRRYRLLGRTLLLLAMGGWFASGATIARAQSNPSNLTVTPAEMMTYAKAYYAIYTDTDLKNLLQQVEQSLGSKPNWNIDCAQPDSIQKLPKGVQGQVVQYCQKSITKVQESGLTVDRFNAITQGMKGNADLQKRLTDALVQVQKQLATP